MKPYVASHLKDMNRQVVYRYIRSAGETSKADIVRQTKISGPTVIKIVEFLQQRGVIVEAGEGTSAMGRKPHMLALNTKCMYALCFFLEGDFLSVGVVNAANQVIFKREKKVVPNLEEIFRQITSDLAQTTLCEAGISQAPLAGVGIALPAIYDHKARTIVSAPLMGIHKPVDIDGMLARMAVQFGTDVVIENDTNAQALGEYCVSDYAQQSDLVFLSLGTGLGAGIILAGKLRHGNNFMCGEIGYFSFAEDYVPGKTNPGWLETRINYRYLEDKFRIRFDVPVSEWPVNAFEDIVEYAAIPVALCINNITMLLDCDTVVLGGVITDALGQPFLDSINQKLRSVCISDLQVKRQSDKNVGLMGIASHIIDRRIRKILQEP